MADNPSQPSPLSGLLDVLEGPAPRGPEPLAGQQGFLVGGQLLDLELDTVRGEDDIGHAYIDLKTPQLRSSPKPNTREE